MRILFLSLFVFASLLSTAQDSPLVKSKVFLPVGCYYSQKSFFNKKPDSEKPFRVVTNYLHPKNGDSIPYGHIVEWADSVGVYSNAGMDWLDSTTKKPVKIFCFSDNKDVYIHSGGGYFFKMGPLGKYPYVYVRHGFTIPEMPSGGLGLTGLTFGVVAFSAESISSSIRQNDLKLYYYNKKREFTEANPEKIAWVLMKDKDFYKEYEKEQKITVDVMIKYLDKMNERYPEF